jgi:hypothetical protein
MLYYKGDTMHKLKCVTKCSYLVQNFLIHPPNSQQNSFHSLLFGEGGSATLKVTVWLRGYLISPSSPPTVIS